MNTQNILPLLFQIMPARYKQQSRRRFLICIQLQKRSINQKRSLLSPFGEVQENSVSMEHAILINCTLRKEDKQLLLVNWWMSPPMDSSFIHCLQNENKGVSALQKDCLHVCDWAAQIVHEEFISGDKDVTFTLPASLFSSNNHISCKRSDLLCETEGKTNLIPPDERFISC